MTLNESLCGLITKYGEDEFPWGLIPQDQSTGFFVRELYGELNETHPLMNSTIRHAVAKCYANDDVLFLAEDGRYYIVRLTYTKSNTAGFPQYSEFLNIETAMTFIEEHYMMERGS